MSYSLYVLLISLLMYATNFPSISINAFLLKSQMYYHVFCINIKQPRWAGFFGQLKFPALLSNLIACGEKRRIFELS